MAALLSRMGRNVRTFFAQIRHDDLMVLRDLIEAGKLRSVIDRTYPLDEAGAAMAYVEAGHARGKVVVTV
ncbi:MAG TPA: zinc-binding dehydrogenase, partial [Candidatus Dormibacteraeota bacterium]|nr:zinc-binding dehydrogenase [Candidatus Dormibacteraeota bacterium]